MTMIRVETMEFFDLFRQSEALKRSANLSFAYYRYISRSKPFDLFPRTCKGKYRCVLRQ